MGQPLLVRARIPVCCLLCLAVVAQAGLARDSQALSTGTMAHNTTVALADALQGIASRSKSSGGGSAELPDGKKQLAAAVLEDGVLEQVLGDPEVARAVALAQRKLFERSSTRPPSTADLANGDAQGRDDSVRATSGTTTLDLGPRPPNAVQNIAAERRLVAASLHRKLQGHLLDECPAPEPAHLQGSTTRRHHLNFSAAYSNSATCTWVVTCAQHEAAFVHFGSFSSYYGTGVDAGYSDALSLYDGVDADAPLLNVLCGNATPTAFAAESGSMTLLWEYLYSSTSPTFVLEYWCAASSTIVRGCTDPSSSSFDTTANADDGSCYDQERRALLDSFQLDLSSRALQSWSAAADPCTCGWEVWEGVTCSQNRRIEGIDISNAPDIAFVLDEELAHLTSLTSLSLWGSGLHGTMPQAAASMPLLQVVDVDDSVIHLTKFDGTICVQNTALWDYS